MTTNDTEEKLLAEMTALGRRLIAFGQRQERDAVRDRLMVAIEGEREAPPPLESAVSKTNGAATHDAKDAEKRPYGFVRKVVSRAVFDAGNAGLSKEDIHRANPMMTAGTIQTALSWMSGHELARYNRVRNRWKGTPKLAEYVAQIEESDAAPGGTTEEQRAD